MVYIFLKSKLQESIKLLEDFKNGTLPAGVTDKQLWDAQQIKQVFIVNVAGQ